MPFESKPSESHDAALTDIDEAQTPIVASFSDNTKLLFEPSDKKDAAKVAMFAGLKMAPENHEEPPGVIRQVRMLVQPAKGPRFFIHKHAPKHYVQRCIERIEKGV